jgi:hypothetical protein
MPLWPQGSPTIHDLVQPPEPMQHEAARELDRAAKGDHRSWRGPVRPIHSRTVKFF